MRLLHGDRSTLIWRLTTLRAVPRAAAIAKQCLTNQTICAIMLSGSSEVAMNQHTQRHIEAFSDSHKSLTADRSRLRIFIYFVCIVGLNTGSHLSTMHDNTKIAIGLVSLGVWVVILVRSLVQEWRGRKVDNGSN